MTSRVVLQCSGSQIAVVVHWEYQSRGHGFESYSGHLHSHKLSEDQEMFEILSHFFCSKCTSCNVSFVTSYIVSMRYGSRGHTMFWGQFIQQHLLSAFVCCTQIHNNEYPFGFLSLQADLNKSRCSLTSRIYVFCNFLEKSINYKYILQFLE